MDKFALLHSTHQTFLKAGVGILPVSNLDGITAPDYMGFGTTADEKMFSLDDLRALVQRQHEQGEGIAMRWEFQNVHTRIAPHGLSAFFSDDLRLMMNVHGQEISMPFRFSCVYEWIENQWVAVHSHGSKPELAETDTDTFGIDEWKQKAAELEQKVAERTAELAQKNRELEIEAALEKVRARSMAMQSPEELIEVAELLRKEMGRLGVEELETSSIYIVDKNKKQAECWYAIKDVRDDNTQLVRDEMTLTLTDTWVGSQMWTFFQSPEEYVSIVMEGDRRKEWINYCAKNSNVLQGYYGEEIPNRTYHLIKFNGGYIGAAAPGAISKESWALLKRVAIVFSLAFTRFNDLQDASARAREAQIELALERVRSRTMAMHKSEELSGISLELVKQVQALGISTWFCAFNIYDDDPRGSIEWGSNGQGVFPKYRTPREGIFLRYYEAGQRGESLLINVIDKETCPAHYEYLCSLPDVGDQLLKMKAAGVSFPTSQIDHVAFFKHGYILFITYETVPEANGLFRRFANVFEQTYTRFLDLQKAEAQARQAMIEASLERIRARAMAMRHSDELNDVLSVLWEQFDVLGIRPMSAHMTVIDLPNNRFTFRETGKYGNRNFGEQVVDLDAMDTWKDTADRWRYSEPETLNRQHFPKEMLPVVWEVFRESFASMPAESRLTPDDYPDGIYHTAGKHPFGYIGINQTRRATEEEEQIVVKFASEFGRVYQRFLDLERAEAQAREAQIEAALERVRSVAMGMKTPADMAGICREIAKQLSLLGLAEIRNVQTAIIQPKTGTYLNYEFYAKHDVEAFTEVDYERHAIQRAFAHKMLKGESYSLTLTGQELKDWYAHQQTTNQFVDILLAQANSVSYYWFSLGPVALGISTYTPLLEAEEMLFGRFRNVFDLAYRRYLDIETAEAQAMQAQLDLIRIQTEKARAEQALTELRSTQAQLIQKEKLASLGELTAGIAHEIQNPLNFVNNFSEVSAELLGELTEEITADRKDAALEIAGDLTKNLEKITLHGQRAASIVRGMLEHSRASTGEKQFTNLNVLAEEYLKLAFHGMKAKDRTFEAELKTEFDPVLPTIEVIPQDIGRVLLNLFNNAFYAVSEKQKQAHDTYKPTLSLQTRWENGQVEIRVRDNGTGIPEAVKAKIFQPFFTTKPTGEGTGLGLSLSYDIITKAHGGLLAVTSAEHQFTEFLICLPITS